MKYIASLLCTVRKGAHNNMSPKTSKPSNPELTAAQTRKIEIQAEIARQLSVKSDDLKALTQCSVAESIGLVAAKKAVFSFSKADSKSRIESVKAAFNVMASEPAFYRLDQDNQANPIYSGVYDSIVSWLSNGQPLSYNRMKFLVGVVAYHAASGTLPQAGELGNL
jgi:hypothetical protein